MPKLYERYDKSGEFECYFSPISAGIMSVEELANKVLYGKPYKLNLAVSRYQGDYAWSDEGIISFLQDLSENVSEKKPYFIGCFTFMHQKKCVKLLDGRHRLIATVLFLCALGDKYIDLLMNFTDIGGKERIVEHFKLVKAWCKDKFTDTPKRQRFAANLRQRVLFIGFEVFNVKDGLSFFDKKKDLQKSGFALGEKTLSQGALNDKNLSPQRTLSAQLRTTNDENRIYLCNIGSLTFHQFEIPRYHRLYEWQGKQINAFLRDIKRAFMQTKELCIGAIITAYQLDSRKVGIYVVLDGLQRLMTLWFVCFYMASKKQLGRWANKYKRLIFYAHGDELRFVAPAQREFGRVLSEFAKTDYDLAVFKRTNLVCIQNAFQTIWCFFERCEKAGVDMEKLAIFIYENIVFQFAKLALDEKEAQHFFARMQYF